MLLDFIILGLVCVVNFGLGFLVFFNKPKSKVHRAFFWLNIAVVFWAFGLFLFNNIGQVGYSLFGIRLAFASAASIAYFLWYFSWLFINQDTKSFSKKILTACPWLIVVFLALATNLIVRRVEFVSWGADAVYGSLYYLFVIYFAFYAILALTKLIRGYAKSRGVKRAQLKFLFLGFLLAIITGSTTNLIVPIITGSSILSKFGPLATIFFVGFTAYSITRYRLMDIRVVVKRTGLYMLLAGFAYGAFYFFIWLFNTLFGSVYAPSAFILGGILAFVFVFCFFWFEKGVRALANQYFFTGLYSQQEALKKLSQEIATILDLDKLVDTVCEVIKPALGLDKIAVVLRKSDNKDHYALHTTIGFKRDNGLSLLKHNVLTEKLEQTRKPIVYQEAGIKGLQGLKKDMKKIEAQVCLPLIVKNQLEGIIILGKKLSGNPYTKQDLELLDIIANQASMALQNARLYGQIQDLSENLQEKVGQQTKKLRQTLQELKQLNATKTEFISMASHQLRTPLTAVQGYASMILEGDYGKIPSKMKGALKNIFKGSKRLIKIVDDLLDVSQIELGQMKLEKEPTDIQCLLEGCRQEMNKRAKEEGLNLIYKQKDRVLPKINIDKDKIRQVILNIIDNAIHYTEKGKIEIGAEQKEKAIVIKVKDSGAGLTEKDKIELFEGFAKGTAGRKFFIQSTGLGLYVARKFILLHNGKIWANSPGKGKGSTFYIQLPLSD